MGCFASVAAPDLIFISFEEDPSVGALVKSYNDFCRKSKEILRQSIIICRRIEPLLQNLIEDSKKTGSVGLKIQECFMNLILFILHYQQSQLDPFRVMFSNYLPGILVEPYELSPKLRTKYENLIRLSGNLPEVFNKFAELCEDLVKCLAQARDYYPKEFYRMACTNSGFSMLRFAEIERDLTDNFQMIAETGLLLDKTFKNCKDTLVVVFRIVEKCDQCLFEVLDIFDGVDEWNYETVPESVNIRIDEFFTKHGIKQVE